MGRRAFTFTLAFLVGVAIAVAPAQAGMTTYSFGATTEMSYVANSSNPGNSSTSCGTGAIVGFQAHMSTSGTWPNGWKIDCQPLGWTDGHVYGTGSITQSLVLGDSVDGTDGNDVTCDAGQVVVGFTPVAGSWMDGVRPICQALAGIVPSGSATEKSTAGGTGGTPQPPVMCPVTDIATGARVHVDSIGPSSEVVAEAFSVFCQPLVDVIAYQSDGSFRSLYNGIYGTDPSLQMKAVTLAPGKSRTAKVSIGNDGTVSDSFGVSGAVGSAKPFTITYFKGKKNVTSKILAGTYVTRSVHPTAVTTLTVVVAASTKAKAGKVITLPLTLTSQGDGTVDAISLQVTIT